ncbi:hypothetical protein BJ508DRAFT_313728 [Ascobolus immersus RN42]|uniref:Uncharacterized protein n=1 Tax=Ascobolus immersus RN42 TaxID=1160509 RepID=A0A3N4HKV7_ASCIM|nr:hypothetical protein BJ508DRAFT_313728 [Ascobolus immersus RN42]
MPPSLPKLPLPPKRIASLTFEAMFGECLTDRKDPKMVHNVITRISNTFSSNIQFSARLAELLKDFLVDLRKCQDHAAVVTIIDVHFSGRLAPELSAHLVRLSRSHPNTDSSSHQYGIAALREFSSLRERLEDLRLFEAGIHGLLVGLRTYIDRLVPDFSIELSSILDDIVHDITAARASLAANNAQGLNLALVSANSKFDHAIAALHHETNLPPLEVELRRVAAMLERVHSTTMGIYTSLASHFTTLTSSLLPTPTSSLITPRAIHANKFAHKLIEATFSLALAHLHCIRSSVIARERTVLEPSGFPLEVHGDEESFQGEVEVGLVGVKRDLGELLAVADRVKCALDELEVEDIYLLSDIWRHALLTEVYENFTEEEPACSVECKASTTKGSDPPASTGPGVSTLSPTVKLWYSMKINLITNRTRYQPQAPAVSGLGLRREPGSVEYAHYAMPRRARVEHLPPYT